MNGIEFKKPGGYVLSTAGNSKNRALSVMCHRWNIEYFLIKTKSGICIGYFYPQFIIDEYDKKHGFEDMNKGII